MSFHEAVESWFEDFNGMDPGVGGWHALEVNLGHYEYQLTEPTDDEIDRALSVNSDPRWEDAAIAMRETLRDFLKGREQ